VAAHCREIGEREAFLGLSTMDAMGEKEDREEDGRDVCADGGEDKESRK
jgi:hypothetical protein